MESSADVNNLPATVDRPSGGKSRSPQWLSSVSQVPLEDKVVYSFIARGKEQPFVCLAISNSLLMHLHVNNEDMVKHIYMFKEKCESILIKSEAAQRAEEALRKSACKA